MQRKIGTEVELGATVSPFDSIRASPAIDRSVTTFVNAREKVQNIRKNYIDKIKYIP